MSFFIKNNKSNLSKNSNRKRKRPHLEIPNGKSDEISSGDDDDDLFDNSNKISEESSDEHEDETPHEKKVRLAKLYLKEIEREENERLKDQEISHSVISQRLKDDHLKQIGRYHYLIADQYNGVDSANIKILKCKEQNNTISCLCVSSNDDWIFSGSKDGVIVKWSLKSMKKLGVIPFVKQNVDRILGHSSRILCLALSTNNSFLAVGDNSGDIQIWNPSTLEHINTLKGHRKPVTGLVFKRNSSTLYSCSEDKSVRVWSVDEMTFVETLFGHQDNITGIDVLDAEKPISAGGKDNTIRLWKVSEESQLIFNAQPDNVDTIKLINEQNFISGSDQGQICIWSSLKKKPICQVKEAHGCNEINLPHWISSVTSLAYSDLMASGSHDGFIRIWKLEDKYRTMRKLFEIQINGFINALAFTSDGKYLIAGCGRDHRLGRWSVIKSAKNAVYIIPLLKNN